MPTGDNTIMTFYTKGADGNLTKIIRVANMEFEIDSAEFPKDEQRMLEEIEFGVSFEIKHIPVSVLDLFLIPQYMKTEIMFPKKKRRGTARRNRKAKRIGCIGCPLAGGAGMRRDFERYPTYKRAYIRAFDKMIENHPNQVRIATGEDAKVGGRTAILIVG